MSSTTTGSKRVGGWVKRHADIVLSLPEPGAEWTWAELPTRADTPTPFPEAVLDYRSKLQGYNVITEVDTVERGGPQWGYSIVWETDRRIYKFAQEKAKERGESLPCGHTAGFKTIDPDAEIYECGYEFCTRRFDRETIENVFF